MEGGGPSYGGGAFGMLRAGCGPFDGAGNMEARPPTAKSRCYSRLRLTGLRLRLQRQPRPIRRCFAHGLVGAHGDIPGEKRQRAIREGGRSSHWWRSFPFGVTEPAIRAGETFGLLAGASNSITSIHASSAVVAIWVWRQVGEATSRARMSVNTSFRLLFQYHFLLHFFFPALLGTAPFLFRNGTGQPSCTFFSLGCSWAVPSQSQGCRLHSGSSAPELPASQ